MIEFSSKNIKIVVGLGNPGKKYENTYHNAGFLFIDFIKTPRNSKFEIRNSKFIKSDTYMNESGNFVQKTLKKSGVKPGELLVAHDDSDIELGKFKLSFGRGSAGHKGVESVIRTLGTKEFWRLRIGVRSEIPNSKFQIPNRKKAGNFVLKKISKRAAETLRPTYAKIAKGIFPILKMGSSASAEN